MNEREWRILLDRTGDITLPFPITRVITGLKTTVEFKTKVCDAILAAGNNRRIIRFAQRLQPTGPEQQIEIHDPAGG
jgi:hypothetical protein